MSRSEWFDAIISPEDQDMVEDAKLNISIYFRRLRQLVKSYVDWILEED